MPSATSSARIALVTITAVVALFAGPPEHHAAASNPADSILFSLTNQDRASNGVASLQGHATLGAIGENLPYSGCGFTVDGRSQDMINRNYFSHPIAGCSQLVFSMMTARGIHYLSAGENIGWGSHTGDAPASANYINVQFMDSPEHRANILNPKYTNMGIGTAQSNSWSGAGLCLVQPGGLPCSDVWMFSEEFAQLAGSPPPPAKPPATPLPPRNSAAPPAPSVPPVTTAVPPASTPTPVPSRDTTAAPLPNGQTGGMTAPAIDNNNPGLLSDSVEAVLEAYLVD